MNEILSQLRRPFHPSHVSWKPQAVTKDGTKGMAVAYADVRAYQNRLDEVCGLDWSVTYTPWGDRLVCHVTICGVTRSSTGEADSQSEKSEIGGTAAESQAFKRACAMFGLGRYLYNLPSVWVELESGTKQFTDKGKAKLESIITQHYRRTILDTGATDEPSTIQPPAEKLAAAAQAASAVAAAQGVAVETVEQMRQEFNDLGVALYNDRWAEICRHNVERITGQPGETTTLTIEQIGRLIEGMRKLQSKRQAIP